MRLLLLVPEFSTNGGGIATFYRDLVPALCAAGLHVRVIEGSAFHATEAPCDSRLECAAIETLDRSRFHSWWDRFSAFAATPQLRRHLAASWAMWEQADFGADADIVEASDWGLLFVPAAVEALRPLVVECHGSVGQISIHDPIEGEETQGILTRLIESAVMRTAIRVQTSSNANAAFWRGEIDREVDVIRPAWKSKVADIKSFLSRGLVVGRVQRWKGPETICLALERLGNRAPQLDWIGRDMPWGRQDKCASTHLATKYPNIWGKIIVSHPQIPCSEVAQRQASALFNLVPSTWDVFNFTVVEAMASGRPAIVSTGAGASELIEDGINGYLFAVDDADALATTLDRVLSEKPERLAAIGRAGQETVRAALDPQLIAIQRLATYQSAVAAFAANPPARPTNWIGDICRPSESSSSDMTFVEHLPLRKLIGHIADRLARRILP